MATRSMFDRPGGPGGFLGGSDAVWWIALLEGIVVLVVGLLLLFSPAITTFVLVQFLGVYWLVSGIFSIVEIFVRDKSRPWGWLLFYGIVGILAGLAVLRHPLLSTIFIPTLLAVYIGIAGIIMGVTNLIQGFTGRGGWAIVLGIVNILIGIFLLSNPFKTALALPIVIGVFAAIGGILLIVSSFRIRDRAREAMPYGANTGRRMPT